MLKFSYFYSSGFLLSDYFYIYSSTFKWKRLVLFYLWQPILLSKHILSWTHEAVHCWQLKLSPVLVLRYRRLIWRSMWNFQGLTILTSFIETTFGTLSFPSVRVGLISSCNDVSIVRSFVVVTNVQKACYLFIGG